MCALCCDRYCYNSLVLFVGVSMGPVVEGVCGYKRPQYNIWGPAMDTARKLELTGKMSHIQVCVCCVDLISAMGCPLLCRKWTTLGEVKVKS